MDLKEINVNYVKEKVMGRAIDMENDIERIFRKISRIEPALEKVINWIAEQESKDDNKKQHKSATTECSDCGSTNLRKPDPKQLQYE